MSDEHADVQSRAEELRALLAQRLAADPVLAARVARGKRRRRQPTHADLEAMLARHERSERMSGRSGGPRMSSVVRDAVLELLRIEPITDSDLVDQYRANEAERGWPPAAANTIRIVRGRLTRAGLVAEAGLEPGLNGQWRKLWTTV